MKKTYMRLTCDRCGGTHAEGDPEFVQWGEISVGQHDGTFRIRSLADSTRPADLCPTCLKSLGEWYGKGRPDKSVVTPSLKTARKAMREGGGP